LSLLRLLSFATDSTASLGIRDLINSRLPEEMKGLVIARSPFDRLRINSGDEAISFPAKITS